MISVDLLKLLHVLFVFVWIGTLLMLTRLLAYLAKEAPPVQIKLAALYRRMYFFIDLPSMILAVMLGIVLLFLKHVDWKQGWLHMKLMFAALLIAADIVCGVQIVKRNKTPLVGRGTMYKILHGVTGLFLIGILIAIYILKARTV